MTQTGVQFAIHAIQKNRPLRPKPAPVVAHCKTKEKQWQLELHQQQAQVAVELPHGAQSFGLHGQQLLLLWLLVFAVAQAFFYRE